MSSRRDSRGRFIADEAAERVRHDIFSTASAESAWLAGLIAADGNISSIPAHGRYRAITRCRCLAEARFHGGFAWAAASWLYADTDLFRSAKQKTFARYQQLLRADPPKWHGWALERQQMPTLMKAGRTPAQIAAETGLPVSRIYTLGLQTRRAAAE
jgi:hypothetical protein